MGQLAGNPVEKPIRVLLVVERGEERAALGRYLVESGLRASPLLASTLAEAVPHLAAGRADLILGDLAAWIALREGGATGCEAARTVPFCVLVPPGAEEQAAALLEHGTADFILQAGDYHRLLPALLQHILTRQETSWEAIARIIRHEMNNPLTGVLGNAELILAEGPALPEKVRQRLTTIVHLAVRLRDVVRDLERRLRGNGDLSDRALPPGTPPGVGLPREVVR